MLTEDYRVRLDAFEGPLDLLLFLIRKAELEITDISIAQIADQYMEHLRHVEKIDIDLAGEFLVVAASLMEIKARALAPKPAGESDTPSDEGESDLAALTAAAEAGEFDPRKDLIRQLIAYKRSRDAAETLDRLREQWSRRWSTSPVGCEIPPRSEEELEDEDLGLYDLVQAFDKIVRSVNFDALGEHKVGAAEDVPIEVHADDILLQLRERTNAGADPAPLSLRDVLLGRRRVEMIGLFLALLELVRSRRVAVAPAGDDFVFTLRDDADGAAMASSPAQEAAPPAEAGPVGPNDPTGG